MIWDEDEWRRDLEMWPKGGKRKVIVVHPNKFNYNITNI